MNKALFLLVFLFFTSYPVIWNLGNIHVIGDSNAAFCFTCRPDLPPSTNVPKPGSLEDVTYEHFSFPYCLANNETIDVDFAIHWVQGRTMHRIGRDGIEGFNIKLYGVQDNDVVVFTFGAIDVGGHVFKEQLLRQVILGRDLDDVIETLVSNYINTILTNQKMYTHLTVVVQTVVPFHTNPHPVFISAFNQAFPGQSFVKYQVNVTKKINKKLEEYSKKNKLLFFDINHLYENSEGALLANLSNGDHHVSPKFNKPFKENLIALLLNAQK